MRIASRRCDDLLEDDRGADRVDRGVPLDLVHRLADADGGGEVVDGVDALERAPDGLVVADVADLELDRRVEVVRPLPVRVDLRIEVVERPNLVPLREQPVGQVRADEAGAAGDQDRASRREASSARAAEPLPRLARMRSRRRAVLRFALGIALAAVVFVEIVPRIASYGSVAHQLATVSAAWAVALAAATLLDILTTALPWQAVLPQLPFVGALAFTQASTALTTVLPGGAPLGMALSFAFLRRLRVDRGAGCLRGRGDRDLEPGDDPRLPAGRSDPRLRHRPAVDLDGRDRRRERRVRRAIVGLAVAALRSEGAARLARRRLRAHRGPGRPALPPNPAGLERGGARENAGGAARSAPPALAEADRRDARQPADVPSWCSSCACGQWGSRSPTCR